MSKLPDDLQDNIVVRDPDPYCFPVVFDGLGDLVARIKDKRLWSRLD
jgi:hypothetical protein